MTSDDIPGSSFLEPDYQQADAVRQVRHRLGRGCRLLIWGPSGTGKSTLTSGLAAGLEANGMSCVGIAADPGSPGFGVPGALALVHWREGAWRLDRLEALCTLDAVRYRLPLVQALSRLASNLSPGPLLVDAPGVVRGPAARELLHAMIEVLRVDLVLAILPGAGAEADVARSILNALDVEILISAPSALAKRRSKKQRARNRTLRWDAWMAGASERELCTTGLRMLGRPLRGKEGPAAFQVALLDRNGATSAFGELTDWGADRMVLRICSTGTGGGDDASAILMRDAVRGSDGLLGTAQKAPGAGPSVAPSPDLGYPAGEEVDPACFAHLGRVSALLVNGVFGDPLLHLRLRQSRRSLLFDLGDSRRLPAKLAHQVSDVFISHAHMDHIGGFLWFLRSRIGERGICRIHGPPGLAEHICAFIAGIRWDRIGDRGPRFEILELRDDSLLRFDVQVGLSTEARGDIPVVGGILLDEAGFRIRAITLDHGIPVLAFAFEAAPSVAVRKDRLAASGLPDGPWLGLLKDSIAAGEEDLQVRLPDGRTEIASTLAEDLLERRPQRRLVYATDLADSPSNRERLVDLALGADALICEAGFREADAAQAGRTGHLTARACGEIAAAARVDRLIPFHFSRRYETAPGDIYAEVQAAFKGLVLRAGASERSRGRTADTEWE